MIVAGLVAVPILAGTTHAADEVVVRPGDTLTSLSRQHGVPIDRLVEINRIANPSRIYVGQRLRIEPVVAAPAPAAAATAPAQPRVHTVRSGEHLTGIARHYGVTIAAIASVNGILNASRINAGQRLTIPDSAPDASDPAAVPNRAMPSSMATLVARRDAVRRVIVEESQRLGVPAAFALAVAWQESGWQQGVVSSAGAIGVMQLLPGTAEWVGATMLGTVVDASDVRQNVRAGVRLLAHYLARYDGDRARVLAAYYQGQTAVDRHGIYAVSRPYIASIAALEAIFGD